MAETFPNTPEEFRQMNPVERFESPVEIIRFGRKKWGDGL